MIGTFTATDVTRGSGIRSRFGAAANSYGVIITSSRIVFGFKLVNFGVKPFIYLGEGSQATDSERESAEQ
ncbi:MAG: hypothetical protein OK436_05120, partial [Thaumarchaeota archaeon]|nr:hypothetical protein [Nitrososphaerota archaeon]